jgi:hypothetical protein
VRVKTQTVKNAAPRGRGAEDDEILSDQRYHEGRLQGMTITRASRGCSTGWHARALKPELDATVVSHGEKV